MVRCEVGYAGLNCTCRSVEERVGCDEEGNLYCLGHWTGILCDVCEKGYYGDNCEQTDSDNYISLDSTWLMFVNSFHEISVVPHFCVVQRPLSPLFLNWLHSSGLGLLMKIIYFVLVALISVLTAVLCAYTVIVVRKKSKRSRQRGRLRGNKVFDRNVSQKEVIMMNRNNIECIEDM